MKPLLAAVALAALGVLAPLVAPFDPDEIVDVMAARHLAPGSEIQVVTRRDGSRFAASSVEMGATSMRYVRGGRAEVISIEDLASGPPERRRFLLGTDAFGRDLLSRVLHGARLSIGVTLLSVVLGLILGVGAGLVSGYAGGAADAVLMRAADTLHAVPRLFMFLLCAALFGPSALLVAVVLGATGWIGIARITRSHVLTLRQSSFSAAAEALGCSPRRIMLRHLLPNCATPIALAAVLLAADTVVTESSLSFIGLGVQPPTASWGSLLAAGRTDFIEAWWVVLFPGLSILLLVFLLHAAAASLGARPAPGNAEARVGVLHRLTS